MPKKGARPKSMTTVDTLKRRDRVREDYYVNRITDQRLLAARYGVSSYTINKDLKAIRKEVLEEYAKRGRHIAVESMNTLDGLIRKAQAAFERSKENSEKIRTEYNNEKCKVCKGSGTIKDDDDFEEKCDNCNGEGTVVVETITKEVTGQAGDPRFLNVVKDCVKEQCKIAGIGMGDSRVNVNVVSSNVDLSRLSDDKVLEALSEIQHSMLPDNSDDNEDDVIDVDFE